MTPEDAAAEVLGRAALHEIGLNLTRLTLRGNDLLGHLKRTNAVINAHDLDCDAAYGSFQAAVDQAMPLVMMILGDEFQEPT